MAMRKVRDRAEAATLLASAARSGVERAQWARENGVDARSLNMWRLNLARRAGPELRLVELVSMGDTPPEPIIVRCGLFTVEVRDGVDEGSLRRVLTAVATC